MIWTATLNPMEIVGFTPPYHGDLRTSATRSAGSVDPYQFSFDDVDFEVWNLTRRNNTVDQISLTFIVKPKVLLTPTTWQRLIGDPAIVLDLSDATATSA